MNIVGGTGTGESIKKAAGERRGCAGEVAYRCRVSRRLGA